jgi:hypothetical protein
LFVCTAFYAAIVTLPLSPSDIEMVVKGNNDIYMYAKVADFLPSFRWREGKHYWHRSAAGGRE